MYNLMEWTGCRPGLRMILTKTVSDFGESASAKKKKTQGSDA